MGEMRKYLKIDLQRSNLSMILVSCSDKYDSKTVKLKF